MPEDLQDRDASILTLVSDIGLILCSFTHKNVPKVQQHTIIRDVHCCAVDLDLYTIKDGNQSRLQTVLCEYLQHFPTIQVTPQMLYLRESPKMADLHRVISASTIMKGAMNCSLSLSHTNTYTDTGISVQRNCERALQFCEH